MFYRYSVWLGDDSGKLLPLANPLAALCWCPLPTLGAIFAANDDPAAAARVGRLSVLLPTSTQSLV